MPSTISQIEFSRICGTSKQAVYKAIKAGKIKVNKKRKVLFDDDLTQLWYQRQAAKNPPIHKATHKPKPDQKEDRLIFSNGTISFPDLFKNILDEFPPTKSKIYISTWQLGKRNIDFLRKIANDHDFKLLLDLSFKNRCPVDYKSLKQAIGGNVWLTKNHSKILAIKNGDLHCTVLSSANFNKNLRLEFFYINYTKRIFDVVEKSLSIFFGTDNISKSGAGRGEKRTEFKVLSSQLENDILKDQATIARPNTKQTLAELKIEEEIRKIRAEADLKELQLSIKRREVIEKETTGAVLFHYLNALNINMLDMPDMVIDALIDKIKSDATRGDLIKIMRDMIKKAIVSTKKQLKERLK